MRITLGCAIVLGFVPMLVGSAVVALSGGGDGGKVRSVPDQRK
jgi:hypothetical protein